MRYTRQIEIALVANETESLRAHAHQCSYAMLPANESRSSRRRPILTADHGDLYCKRITLWSDGLVLGIVIMESTQHGTGVPVLGVRGCC